MTDEGRRSQAEEAPSEETGASHRVVRTNGISMHVAEAGSGPPVVLCHGFPELWYSWRHQIPALAAAGHHVLAPDQRGYGGTDAPDDVAAYDIVHLVGDLVGLLDAYGYDDAVFVGHDWGAIVVWQLALLAPERVRGVVNMSVPFVPRLPSPPTEVFRQLYADRFFYILYFQEEGRADEELSRDPRRSLAAMFAAPSWGGRRDEPPEAGLLDRIGEPAELPPWLSERDLDYYAGEFDRSGFTGPLHWYRNFDRNWELTDGVPQEVSAPALFVTGERDPVARFAPSTFMRECVPGLRGEITLEGAGHWIQQERPDEVNRLILEFLGGL